MSKLMLMHTHSGMHYGSSVNNSLAIKIRKLAKKLVYFGLFLSGV